MDRGGRALGPEVALRMIERERQHYADRGWGEWATVERDTGDASVSVG